MPTYQGTVTRVSQKYGKNGAYWGISAKGKDGKNFWFSRSIKLQNSAPVRFGAEVTVDAEDFTIKGDYTFLKRPTLRDYEEKAVRCEHRTLTRQLDGSYQCESCLEEGFVTFDPSEAEAA